MRSSHLLSVGIASLLIACGQTSEPDAGSAQDPDGAASSEGADDATTSVGGETGDAGDDESGESGSDDETGESEDGLYTVHGRAELEVADAASVSPRALGQNAAPIANKNCPFAPDSAPCTDEACAQDMESEECQSVIADYCGTGPDDPACEPSGEPWACDEDPDFPPCEVCLDPEHTDEDCQQAWNDHCNMEPDSMWCDNDGGDDGGPPDAVFPVASLSLLVHQVEFSLDADCSDPILVADAAVPEYVNFADNPDLFTAEPPPPGTYPCVIITMSDHIRWSVDGDNACSGSAEQDVHRGEDGEEAEETVRMYISTAGGDDEDGDHDNPFEAPGILLEGPLEIGPGVAGSTFVVGFPDGVHLREEDGAMRCDAQKPSFRFETTYE